MKKLKKLISIILVLSAISTTTLFCSVNVFAVYRGYDNSGVLGPNVTFNYDSYTGKVYINGSGNMYTTFTPNYPKGPNNSVVTSATIESGITSIAGKCFYTCTNMTSVSIPSTVRYIGDCAFFACRSLKSISLPDSLTYIGDEAFYDCDGLTYLRLPKSITHIGKDAFIYCDNLVIHCYKNSVAGNYVLSNGINHKFICDGHVFTKYYSDGNVTCTEDGTQTAYCDNGCGAKNKIVKEALGHSYTNYVADGNGTCKDGGTQTAICDNGCGSTDTKIIEHNYTIVDRLIEPTCTKLGTVMYVCECGYYYMDDIPMIPHSYTEYVYNDDATCTSDGTKTALCDYGCKNSDTVSAENTMIPHLYTDYSFNNDSSCTENGTQSAYCDYGCGSIDTVIAEDTMLPHTYKMYISSEATCTKEGVLKFECECGDFFTEAIPVKAHEYNTSIVKDATCSETGLMLYKCTCSSYYTEVIPLKEHSGEWIITKAPTTTSEGERTKTCNVCGNTETEAIPMLLPPALTVNNYDILVSNADDVKYIRYASGEYTTASQIKNAAGCVTLNQSKVASYTENGLCKLAMANGGIYSLWIKLSDGTEYIYKADLTVMDQELEAYGVTMTVKNLYGVKDFFIAEGDYDTYAELKANYIFNATSAKIGTKHDYTYTVKNPGVHTVLIRYKDTARANEFIKINLTVDEPVFTTNGLRVTVGNIPDVKVIRTAYGEYNTPGEVKRAEGSRNFSNKSVIKNADDYTIQYREEGIVTIVVEYNNGYVKVFHYDVQKKSPTVEQNGNIVSLGNLDGLYVIRYAEGEYTTPKQIKTAPGNRVIKSEDILDGYITVTLNPGIYTFYVQYDDESYNYYNIVVE